MKMIAATDQTSFEYDGPATRSQRIMELVVPENARQQLPLVVSMVSHLSRSADDRWLTCIGASFVSKRDCESFQVHWQRLLQVIPDSRHDAFELAERALAAGKSHTVVYLAAKTPTPHQLYRLECAAAAGNCQGMVVHSR